MKYRDLFMARHGGVVTTGEFSRDGDTQSILFWNVAYGSLIRVRKGLYCDAGLPRDAIRALRVGGRLACASALAFHGERGEPLLLHVVMPGNTPVVRDPDTGQPGRTPEKTVIHWSRRRLAGDRVAVSAEEAYRQAERRRALLRDTL